MPFRAGVVQMHHAVCIAAEVIIELDSVGVNSKIVLGRYIGTNDFFVRKNGKYVFKEHDYIKPKK